MYSFEGDFRRKPSQNLAGASAQRSTDRESLIQQSQLQRQKREEHRKRLHSTIKIQAYVRGFLTRTQCKQNERQNFDNLYPKTEDYNEVLLYTLLTKILFFYNDKKDINRLISLSQLLLKQSKKVMQSSEIFNQIRRMLALHIRILKLNDATISFAVPLRMLEVFTSVSNVQQFMSTELAINKVGQTFFFLVNRGYFQELRHLMDDKTPPLYGVSNHAPTPLCSSLFDLIQRPLQLTTLISAPEFRDLIMSQFIVAFLCPMYTDPVEMYVLPALASDIIQPFPYVNLIHNLSSTDQFTKGNLFNSTWLLHSVLALEPTGFVNDIRSVSRLPNNPLVLSYLKILAKLTSNLSNKQVEYDFEDSLYTVDIPADNDDSDSEHEDPPISTRESDLIAKCIELINSDDKCIIATCSQIVDMDLKDEFLESIAEICHNLLLNHKLALQKYRLLYTLAFKPVFLRSLWRWLSSLSHASSFGGSPTPLLSALSRGMGLDASVIGVEKLLAPLAVFCALFSLLIGTLHDTEFCRDDLDEEHAGTSGDRIHAFRFSELGSLCRTLRLVCLGLVELAYPDTRPPVYDAARDLVPKQSRLNILGKQAPVWSHLFKVCTHLMRSLYVRSARLHFCAEEDWTVDGAVAEGAMAVSLVVRHENAQRDASGSRTRTADEGPPLTTKELRTVMILREIPFVVPFSTRVCIFQGVLAREKRDHFYELSSFNEGPSINISVRRTHLYEDAFDKLRPDNEPDMKVKMRVQLINQVGAEEAGVDGGGLFREFLSELLKSAFDPNRGLFRLTKDNMLYPNPGVNMLYDDFPMHYYFVGRMLGKAMYENLLVELRIAEFFLEKLCSVREPDVHALASLDPALYRGLLILKSYQRDDVPDLGLDFTMLSDELGEQRVDELKPGGANIPVTADNRIEYIHLVADYKLNRQIRSQCNAFKRGLTSVVSGEWLRMFSCRELQLLMSGAEVPIDLNDLREHTQYSGVFSVTHPTVVMFWKAVQDFTDDQRRMLLKFVTSCSRPPLLGFKELQPPFCIQSAGATDRLPSASTCMNLLKLPEFDSEAVLSDKLLYAIQAGAGFELS